MENKTMKVIIQFRRDTTANWIKNKDVVPYEGEPCLDTDTGLVKYGDGVTTYENLKSSALKSSHYEGVKQNSESDMDVINRVLAAEGVSGEKDDIFIVKHAIAGDKYSYTAYVFNGTAWVAMDGNYNAKNVYFDRNLLTTVAVGHITLDNGQAEIPSVGKNIEETWDAIFLKENKNIAVTNPSVTVGGTLKYVEVGSSDSQTIAVTYEDGKYEYGYTTESGSEGDTATDVVNNGTTGATVTAYKLTDGTNDINPTAGGGNSFAVSSGTKTTKASFSVKGSATYGNGHTPVSNLKKMYPAKAIKAGTTTEVSKELFRWYLPMYYGFKYSANVITDPANITADEVKALDTTIKDANAYNATKPTSVTATGSWRQFFVAVPASYNANLKSFIDSNNLPSTVEKATNVTLTLGTASIEYAVWYVNYPADYDTTKIALTW